MDKLLSAELLLLLRRGIETGPWTLENLDTPSAGFTANTRTDKRTFQSGYQGIKHRNLLRDQPSSPAERVQVISERDFVPAPDPLPIEPNQDLDGITTITNPPNPDDLPF